MHDVLQVERIFVVDQPLYVFRRRVVGYVIAVLIDAYAVRIFRRAGEQHLRIGNDGKRIFAVFRREVACVYFFPTERVYAVRVCVIVIFGVFAAGKSNAAEQAVRAVAEHIVLYRCFV